MSWKKYLQYIQWYDVWQGLNSTEGDTPFDPKTGSSFLQLANNVYSPPYTTLLKKRPGFAKVRTNAVGSNQVATATDYIFTGMWWQSDLADNFLEVCSSVIDNKHSIYKDTANPAVAVAGGTDFTVGGTNLISAVNFTDGTNPMTIFATRTPDTMQSVRSNFTRADFSPTGTIKAKFLEVLNQRLLLGAPTVSAVAQINRVYWSDLRNGATLTDNTVQFQSFETEAGDNVTSLKKFGEVALVGKLNDCFYLAPTPFGQQPFGFPRPIPTGRLRGPVSNNAVVSADRRLFWMGQTNIHMMDAFFRVTDIGNVIRPSITALNPAYRQYACGGYEPVNRLVYFGVANGVSTTNNVVIAISIDTGAIWIWSLARNCFAHRMVSSAEQLVGGGYTGYCYNEATGKLGDLDDATVLYDADAQTPRYWLNGYGVKQKVPYIFFTVAPQATETITAQYRLDDGQTWLNPANTYPVTGTSHQLFAMEIKGVAERVQLRFRNNTASEIYNIKAVGIPGKPLVPVVQ